jgi:hypothetical protein
MDETHRQCHVFHFLFFTSVCDADVVQNSGKPSLLCANPYMAKYIGSRYFCINLISRLLNESLGKEVDIRHLAGAMEACVRRFLFDNDIEFVDEEAQRRSRVENEFIPTPDFLLKSPIMINGREVNWIEVKSFYGAGSITEKQHFMGQIPAKAEQYVSHFGLGALAFSLGFHHEFARRVERHAVCLDLGQDTMSSITVNGRVAR